MKVSVEVREHAWLTTEPITPTLDQATISRSAFDWLCQQTARHRNGGAPIARIEGKDWLRLDNYVGVVETPCGTRIEILPKIADSPAELGQLRELLVKMLTRALDLRAREVGPAQLRVFEHPPSEWLMNRFLWALDRLVKRGIRFDYKRVEEESRFLRGQLDVTRQLRQPPGRQHIFHIRHDVFSPDRAENRLLKTAVELVRQLTRNPANWRLAHELALLLEPIPDTQDIDRDFGLWRSDRLMAHYMDVRPWCELLLRRTTPFTQRGDWRGLSLLFPMEVLFERYVGACLAREINATARFTEQAASEWLCRHADQNWFQLRPDLLISVGNLRVVMDTKWKAIDASLSNRQHKYGLSQADFYQLYAYGQRYLRGEGDLFLIYPKTRHFAKPLPPFYFGEKLRLWVVPFDLEADALVGGDWCNHSGWWMRDGISQCAPMLN